ncbi:MAG: penicillin-binding protein 2 [Acidimicrobiia bacterium]
MTVENDRLRASIIGVIVVALFGALLARLWYLQVASGTTYAVAAERNSVRLVPTTALRGEILDRQGRPLVVNRIADVITVERPITPKDRAALAPVVRRLAKVLGRSPADIEQKLDDKRLSVYAPVPVAVDVPIDAVTYVSEHADEFPHVKARAVPIRAYPNGQLAAHLLGYVGEIGDKELEAHSKDGYQPGDQIGKDGVERAFEADLRGKPGIDKLEVDPSGRVLGTLGSEAAQPGHDVRLTLDLDVQKSAEEALRQGLEAARGRFDKRTQKHYLAPAGAAVVIDARDGSVVAMASNPTFDPAAFVNGISTDEWKFLNDKNNHFPLANRVSQGQYAPGSTFKLVTALAAMKDGLVSSGTSITDKGSLTYAGQTFRNAGNEVNGRVNLPRAITVSSDVYFYSIGRDYWRKGNFAKTNAPHDPAANGIQAEAHQFGFGAPTGISLAGEAVGRIPDEAWKKKFNETNPDPRSRQENSVWFPGDNIQLAVGQGDLLVTPLQLAMAYSAFANGGTLYTPRLADRVTGTDGATVRTVAPVKHADVPIDPGARAALLSGLRGVVTDKRGTAAAAFTGFPFSQVPLWGKTGTAEVANRQDTSLFVASPTIQGVPYVVAVVVEEAGRGAEVAAPIARRIIESLAGIAPTPVVVASTPNQGN